jgi:hypothetical protein
MGYFYPKTQILGWKVELFSKGSTLEKPHGLLLVAHMGQSAGRPRWAIISSPWLGKVDRLN